MGRNSYKLGKCALFPVVPSGDTQNFSVVAEVVMSLAGVPVVERIDRGVESDPVAHFPTRYCRPDGGDYSCGFMSHHQWGYSSATASVHAVYVTSAYSARFDPDQHFVDFQLRIGDVAIVQLHVVIQYQCFHK